MKLEKRKLVTIIIQDVLEKDVISDIQNLGIKGYTCSPATGEGLNHTRDSGWEGRNVRIETIVKEETSIKVMEMLSKNYFDKYSVVAFLQDVEVFRKEKFMN